MCRVEKSSSLRGFRNREKLQKIRQMLSSIGWSAMVECYRKTKCVMCQIMYCSERPG